MEVKLEDILKNDKQYIRILRLLHLIKGVNKSIENSKEMNSALMERQYIYLKKEYTQELLEQLAEYQLPVLLDTAA